MNTGRSFLKWAGGKHRVADLLIEELRKEHNNTDWIASVHKRYHEPMLGSGSMFFRLKKEEILGENNQLSDINNILIQTMKIVCSKRNLSKLKKRLEELQNDYPQEVVRPKNLTKMQREKRFYYQRRSEFNRLIERQKSKVRLTPEEKVEMASLMIFLNKTCFNGLWRVNSEGYFNVPEGQYKNPRNIFQPKILDECSDALPNIGSLKPQDWKKSLNQVNAGEFVYFDPPYLPINKDDKIFTSYFTEGFSYKEQVELAEEAASAASRGVRVVLSNHDSTGDPTIRQIYETAVRKSGLDIKKNLTIVPIPVSRNISCKGEGRIKVTEVLIFISN